MAWDDQYHKVDGLRLTEITDLMRENLTNRPECDHHYTVNDETIAIQEPRPTLNQPGNNIVYFPNNVTQNFEAPSWNDMEASVNPTRFKEEYKNMSSKPLSESVKGTLSPEQQAGILAQNEVARRVEGELYLSGSEVRHGIDKAMRSGDPFRMTDMFRDLPEQRNDAYQEIVRSDLDDDDDENENDDDDHDYHDDDDDNYHDDDNDDNEHEHDHDDDDYDDDYHYDDDDDNDNGDEKDTDDEYRYDDDDVDENDDDDGDDYHYDDDHVHDNDDGNENDDGDDDDYNDDYYHYDDDHVDDNDDGDENGDDDDYDYDDDDYDDEDDEDDDDA